MLVADVIVGNEWRGGAENCFSHDGGEAERGIFGVLVLLVAWLMRFVDDDEAKVFDGREQRGARPNDDLGLLGLKGVLPDLVSKRLALARVD